MTNPKPESPGLLAAKLSAIASAERGQITRTPNAAEDLDTRRALEVLSDKRDEVAAGLGALIHSARAGDPSAVRRLKIFGEVSDPVLATKLALMNRAARRRYLSLVRKEKGRRSARRKGGAR